MTRNLKNTILLFILSCCFYSPLTGQSPGHLGNYQSPKVLSYTDLQDFGDIPQELFDRSEKPDQSQWYDIAKFHPIGWSKKGHFAWMVAAPTDLPEYIRFYIQDMITDSIVVNREYNGDHFNDPDGHLPPLEYIWKTNLDSFEQDLKQYQIVQQDSFELLSYPISSGNNKFWVNIQFQPDIANDYSPYNGQLQLDLIQLNDSRKKTIHQSILWALGVDLPGYLKSPFEERVAIMLVQIIPGQHFNPPHSVHFELVGALLR